MSGTEEYSFENDPAYRLQIDTGGLVDLVRRLEHAPDEVVGALKLAMMEALELLSSEAQERTPIASGVLRASIFPVMPQVQGDAVIGAVVSSRDQTSGITLGMGSPLNYAVPVELGTKPHMPPLQPLIDWVKLKLGIRDPEERETVAQKIRWKIYRHGTPGHRMFLRALEVCKPRIDAIFAHYMRIAIERTRGGSGS
ncbi:MAG: HK97 gp10 family phage protein [Magnetococcales bacterium]|nr:HK97 gp10 family phage protein [Magnetococcales bacterium]